MDVLFPLSVGEEVEINRDGLWHTGTVTDVLDQGSLGPLATIRYDAFEAEDHGVALASIRRASRVRNVVSALFGYIVGFRAGSRVLVLPKGRKAFQTGVVVKVLHNGLYRVRWGPSLSNVSDAVSTAQLRLRPKDMDPKRWLVRALETVFTAKGHMRLLGIKQVEVFENHRMPRRFALGTPVMVHGRVGVFRVTGYAANNDATFTLVGLRRAGDEERAGLDEEGASRADRRARAAGASFAGLSTMRLQASEPRGLISSVGVEPHAGGAEGGPGGAKGLAGRASLEAMQVYMPQASWRIFRIVDPVEVESALASRGAEQAAEGFKAAARLPHSLGLPLAPLEVVTVVDAKVQRDRASGEVDLEASTYTLRFGSGLVQSDFPASDVVEAGHAPSRLRPGQLRYSPGDVVTLAQDGEDTWMRIESVLRDRPFYTVEFADESEVALALPADSVRVLQVAPFSLGASVEVNYRGKGRLTEAEVVRVDEHPGGVPPQYVVRYTKEPFLGEVEEGVEQRDIYNPGVVPKKGDTVVASSASTSVWYVGKVRAVHRKAVYECHALDTETYKNARPELAERVPEKDLDSPLEPERYTAAQAAVYRKLNAAMFGRAEGDSLDQPPKILSSDQVLDLRRLVEHHSADVWEAFHPHVNDIPRNFWHTVRDAQTTARRANYLQVSDAVHAVAGDAAIPIDALDANGLSPLYLASAYSDEDIAWHLLQHGADPLRPCAGLKSPAHLFMDPTMSITSRLLVAALTGLEGRPGRRTFDFAAAGGRKRAATYDFSFLNSSFYDLEPHATPNCFLSAVEPTDPWRHVSFSESPLRSIVDDKVMAMLDVPVVAKLLEEMWTRFAFDHQALEALGAFATIVCFMLYFTRLFGAAPKTIGAAAGWADWDARAWILVALAGALGMLVILGVRAELFEIRRLGNSRYRSDGWNYIEASTYTLLALALALDVVFLLDVVPEHHLLACADVMHAHRCVDTDLAPWKRRLEAVAGLLTWVRGLRYATMVRSVGVLARMVGKMLSEVATFLVIFAFFLFGWATALTLIMQDRRDGGHPFVDFGSSVLYCFRLSLGDFDFEDFTDYEEERVAAVVLWASFLVMGTVLMLNLLIAQLSNVYAVVTENVEGEYLLAKAEIVFNVQDQLFHSAPGGVAGRGRLEGLELIMSHATEEEQAFNRRTREVVSRDTAENEQDRLQAQVDEMQVKIARLYAQSKEGRREEASKRGGSSLLRSFSPRRSGASTSSEHGQ